MGTVDRDALVKKLALLRKRLERAFSTDTAAQGFQDATPSTGHCAAVAVILHELLGGEMVCTLVEGHSHWFNRLRVGEKPVDVDLTGDQFGRPLLQVADAGALYADTRVRMWAELSEETLARARLLAERADLRDAVRSIDAARAIHSSPTTSQASTSEPRRPR